MTESSLHSIDYIQSVLRGCGCDSWRVEVDRGVLKLYWHGGAGVREALAAIGLRGPEVKP